jgi:hypothetical protein
VLRARRSGQPPLEVDEDGPWQVACGVRGARAETGDVAADVGEHDLAGVRLPPRAGDDRGDHARDASWRRSVPITAAAALHDRQQFGTEVAALLAAVTLSIPPVIARCPSGR